MKIYIAGAISGVENYEDAFIEAAELLLEQGHIVLNPATLPEGMSKSDYMAICLPMLLRADAIYMLKGWMDSNGAGLEYHLACYIGLQVFDEEEDDEQ